MKMRKLGALGEISALTLGGAGIAGTWGPTNRPEAVATVQEAVQRGITFIDVAPTYGRGEAEEVIGEAFGGNLPAGIRISTKCRLGNPDGADVLPKFEKSLSESLLRMKLDRVDLFLLHGQIVPDHMVDVIPGTSRTLFGEAVRPAMEQLKRRGVIAAWGITGIGVPQAILDVLADGSPPAAVQAIANVLNSPGSLRSFEGPSKAREIIEVGYHSGVGVFGIRAVQGGALTKRFDREIPKHSPDLADYENAAPFRAIAMLVGESPAALAHRYALTIKGVSTVVLGVKNRMELLECIEAESKGPLDAPIVKLIDEAVASQKS